MTPDRDVERHSLDGAIPAALVAGVPVDDVTTAETVELVDAFVAEGRATGRTFQIATINVDFVVNALADHEVLGVLQRAELCVPDGMPILWHARLAGTPLRERVPGADLVPLIVESSRSSGSRVLLFGSSPGVAESAARHLAVQFPGASVSGLSGPYLNDAREIDDEWIEQIVSLRPDIICVALGNPKQERFIDEFRSRLGASVLIGVGGTLDFIVGGRRRAPKLAQRLGLEWVFRAAQEPGRLGRRYFHDAVAFGPYLGQAAIRRFDSRNSASHLVFRLTPEGRAVVIDLSGLDIDGPGDVARLVGLYRDARRRGVETTLVGCHAQARETLKTSGVVDLFRFSQSINGSRN